MGRTLVIVGVLLILSAGCGGSGGSTQLTPPSQSASQPPVAPQRPSDDLLGIWVVESAELMGQKSPAEDAGGMKLEFHPDKTTWHFRLPDGWKSWDGTLRYDPKTDPKQVDLSEPSNPDKVAFGIYKIEGNKLTITMGAERPKDFEEPSWTKMVLKRQ